MNENWMLYFLLNKKLWVNKWHRIRCADVMPTNYVLQRIGKESAMGKKNKDYCRAYRQKKDNLYEANDAAKKELETKKRNFLSLRSIMSSRKKKLLVWRSIVWRKHWQPNCSTTYLQQPLSNQHLVHLLLRPSNFSIQLLLKLKDHFYSTLGKKLKWWEPGQNGSSYR